MPLYLGNTKIDKFIAKIEGGTASLEGNLTVITPPTKLVYDVGDSFDPRGMKVVATIGGLEVPVGSYTVSPDPLVEGTTEVVLTYELDGKIATGTQSITVNSFFEVLQQNSWESIARAAAKGIAKNWWNVGDTKTFAIGSTTYTAMIVGFDFHALRNTDTEYNTTYNNSSKKAAITFIVKELQAEKRMHSTKSATNHNNTEMAKTTLPALYDTLPTELQNVMRLPTYYCSHGNNASSSTQTSTTTCKIFLPSAWEIVGNDIGGTGDKTQLPYFANGNSKILKYSGSASIYWTRTSNNDSTDTYYRQITTTGTTQWSYSTSSRNYTFLFCI